MGNRYEVLRKLGQGGMGTVYLARLKGDAGFERLVALKKLSQEALSNADLRGLFEREIKLGARLVHPCIIQTFDAGLTGGEPYLATEFVDGGDLEDVLAALKRQGGALPPEAIAYLASQVCAALAFMRSVTGDDGKPLIQAHRDVSPGNVLVSRQGAVKLADFGVARLTVSQTSSAIVRGKWQYFAPEIATQDPDVRADLFALGIVMYQLATLTHPFEAQTAQGFYERASTFHPPQPQGMPHELWTVVERALAKDPAQRFQTPEELGDALDRFIFAGGKPMTASVLARLLAPLLPPQVPATPDPALSQPFAGASQAGGTFEMDPEWHAAGPALGADGRLVGELPRPAAPPPPRAPEPLELQSLAQAHAPPGGLRSLAEVDVLELHEKPLVEKPPPEATADGDRAQPRRRGLGFAVGLVALVLLGAGGWYAWQVLPRPDVHLSGAAGADAVVLIDSEPPGAEVYSGKERLGTTPLTFANDYPDGQLVTLTVRRRGYKPQEVGFAGGKPQHVLARLERAR